MHYVLISNQLFIYQDSTEKVISDSVKGKYDYYTHLVIKDSTHIICTDNEGVSIWNIATKNWKIKAVYLEEKELTSVRFIWNSQKLKTNCCWHKTILFVY